MKRADLVLGFGVLLLVGFVVSQTLPTTRTDRLPTAAVPVDVFSGDAELEVVSSDAALPAPERDVSAIRATLAREGNGTYIGDVLALRDSNLARWIARPADPVRVWIDERPAASDFDVVYPSQVRRAFTDWGSAGVPLTFNFVADSQSAEVKVTFVDRLEEPISGRTRWVRDLNWWILRGEIVLALRTPSDRVASAPQLYAIALHEVGHLLGLDHTTDSLAIMAPRVRVLDLTPADVATMRLLYNLPPGSVRWP